jgi:Tol biopolymer transport system component
MIIIIRKTFIIFIIFTFLFACKKSFEPISSILKEPKIAYLSRADSTTIHDLKTIEFDGSEKTNLIQLDLWYNLHCFSSDGKKIVFDSNKNIFVITIEDKELSQLTFNDRINEYPQFLPNSSKIIFKSSKYITISQTTSEIYSIDVNGNNEVSLSGQIASDTHPIPSPDGSKISFMSKRTGNWELWIMDCNGQNQINITNNLIQELNQQFSPDGSKIIFESIINHQREIFIIDSDGNNLMQLTSNLGSSSNARFSPDGAKILFSVAKDGLSKLYLMDIDTRELTYLENKIEGNWDWDEHPQFSADGEVIIFQSFIDNSFEICKMNVDGTNQMNITNDSYYNIIPIVYP